MTNNKKHKSNGHNHGAAGQVVHVQFSHPAASAVAIAGTFNDWQPEHTPMVAVGEGRWLKDLVLPPGTYEYLFVADGKWLADPLAAHAVPNPFGGVNSVITVPKDREANGRRNRRRHRAGL